MPRHAVVAQVRSASAMPARVGPVGSWPVMLMNPDIPCPTWSNPGRWLYGPVLPNPVILQ